jgi:hypothetical protein
MEAILSKFSRCLSSFIQQTSFFLLLLAIYKFLVDNRNRAVMIYVYKVLVIVAF